MTDDAEFRIARLTLTSDDVLVVKVSTTLTPEMAVRMHIYFERKVPVGVKVLIVESGTELSVLTRADIDARAA